jgi:F0F1-type ATP synthase membrane subunit c/vacuolar-type H+-ATPase subunit K
MAADLTRTGTPCLADPHAPIRVTVVAGAAIAAGQCCYIAATGLAALTDKTIVTIANVSNFEGIALTAAAIGEPVTLFGLGAKIKITDTAQTIGTFWYISDTPGELYDAAVATADTYLPVGRFITTTVMEIVRAGV